VGEVVQTPGSLLAFGTCGERPVVLKLVDRSGSEFWSGEVLESFGGCGVVAVLEHTGGAVLVPRLLPGSSLADRDIPDDEATAIIADVIGRMAPSAPPRRSPSVEALAVSFSQYLASGASAIARPLVTAAQGTYLQLCASQAEHRLLHGDLHHHNVLFDSRQGWLAIDPKGVVGELAYEVGAAMRNPCEHPEVFAAPAAIRRRAEWYARTLRLDQARILGWTFAQAVLAAIWELEDDGELSAGAGWIALAGAVRPMV
jgi:streptomycin 6-kinase